MKNDETRNYFDRMNALLIEQCMETEIEPFDGFLPGDNVMVCRDHYEEDGTPILWEDSF